MTEPLDTGGLPALDLPLGSLEHRLARPVVDGFEVMGRRVRVTGTAADGIGTVRAGRVVARDLQIRDAAPAGTAAATESPLGVTRTLDAEGGAVVERVVVSRDAPIAWIEWTRAGDPTPRPATGDAQAELVWRVPSSGSGPAWEHDGRALTVNSDAGVRTLFLLSGEPEALAVEAADESGGGLAVRVRVPFPANPDVGLRLAILAIGATDDVERLIRIAGRTAVAVRGREGLVSRLLADGLTVVSPEPALDHAVARARLRFDASRIETAPGGWSLEDAAGEVLGRLAAGDFEAVRGFLRVAADHRTRCLFRVLAGRSLAWSGDRAPGLPDGPDALDPGTAPRGVLPPVDPAAEPVRRVVEGLLGVEPDAPRGRLVLRPRLPESWDHLEVRGLTIGAAAVDVAYRRNGSAHRLTLTQTRGSVPLQAVLAPELPGGRVRETRVDGEPAELDPVREDGRWRVPVQLVLDVPRTLEVEFGPDSL